MIPQRRRLWLGVEKYDIGSEKRRLANPPMAETAGRSADRRDREAKAAEE